MKYIKVSDKNGKYNNWNIEHDMGDYYEVFCGNFITVLSKNKCWEFEGNMISSEIRSFNNDEDTGGKSDGSEKCNVCGREVRNLSRLMITENTDRYICVKCAKTLDLKTKAVRV